MRLTVSLTGLFVFAIILSSSAYASVPQLINLQGKLLNASTHERLDGNYDFTFEIYNAETLGSRLWYETYSSGNKINVNKGLFSVYLGGRTALNLDFSEDYWLQIAIHNGTDYETLNPRVQIASSGYAYKTDRSDVAATADYAANADKLDSIDGSSFLRNDVSATQTMSGDLDMGGNNIVGVGNVGIGTAAPAEKLDVQGNINASGDISGNRLCISSEDCKGSWDDVGGGWSNIIEVTDTSGTPWAGTILTISDTGGGGLSSNEEYSNTYYLSNGGLIHYFNEVAKWGSSKDSHEANSIIYSDTSNPPTTKVGEQYFYRYDYSDNRLGLSDHLIVVPIEPGSYVRLYRRVMASEYSTGTARTTITTQVAKIFEY